MSFPFQLLKTATKQVSPQRLLQRAGSIAETGISPAQAQKEDILLPGGRYSREYSPLTKPFSGPATQEAFGQPVQQIGQKIRNIGTAFQKLPENLMQTPGAATVGEFGKTIGQTAQLAGKGAQILGEKVFEKVDPFVAKVGETLMKGVGKAAEFFGAKPAGAQGQFEYYNSLPQETRNIIDAINTRGFNPDKGIAGGGNVPNMRTLTKIMENWDSGYPVQGNPPPMYYYLADRPWGQQWELNFTPEVFIKDGKEYATPVSEPIGGGRNRISGPSLDELFNGQGEGNWFMTQWRIPDGTTHIGGVKGKENWDAAIAAGWKPVRAIMRLGNWPPTKPTLIPPDGQAVPPQPPLRPPYFPLPWGTPTTKAPQKQNLAQRIRELIIPTAEAASPEEIEEVRETMGQSKTFNLSKAKKLSNKDIMKAVFTIEKKAKLAYPGDRTKQAIYTALAMKQQLGNQSLVNDWVKNL